jgi:EmrB/QacA subfamily drug resistance transporter
MSSALPGRLWDMTAEQMTERSRWIALYVLCAGVLMIVLDVTIVNVALPSIQDDLGFTNSSLAWVVNAYLIAFGGLLLLAGRLGDLIGRRTIFLAGLAVFTGASLLCGLAQSEGMLVAARFVQGIGGAMTSAVVLGMIVTMFPEPREQAKAIGVYAFVASAGGSVGLLLGGVITQAISWHWIFFVNVPIGIATAIYTRRLLDRDAGIGLGAGADVPGAVLITGALMLGVYTIVKPAAEDGWGATSTLALGAVSLALLAAFVLREAAARTPLVPLRIFRSRNVTGANLIQVLSVAGMFGVFFLGSLYLERVLHYSALEIGLAFLPVTLVMGTLSVRYSEQLIMRFGARTCLFPGLGLIALALVYFTRVPVDGNYVTDILPVMVLLGAGAGTCFPALMTLAMSGATPADAGLASGLVNTGAQAGGALGLAILAQRPPCCAGRLAGRGADGRLPRRLLDRRRADPGVHRRRPVRRRGAREGSRSRGRRAARRLRRGRVSLGAGHGLGLGFLALHANLVIERPGRVEQRLGAVAVTGAIGRHQHPSVVSEPPRAGRRGPAAG